jgi:hypothetical protein
MWQPWLSSRQMWILIRYSSFNKNQLLQHCLSSYFLLESKHHMCENSWWSWAIKGQLHLMQHWDKWQEDIITCSFYYYTSSMLYHYRTSKYVTICFVMVIVVRNDGFWQITKWGGLVFSLSLFFFIFLMSILFPFLSHTLFCLFLSFSSMFPFFYF